MLQQQKLFPVNLVDKFPFVVFALHVFFSGLEFSFMLTSLTVRSLLYNEGKNSLKIKTRILFY